jgi:uncharacterized protein YukJ
MVWGRTAADQGAAQAFFSVKHYVFNTMCKQLCLKHDGKLLLSISYGCPEPLWAQFDRLSRRNLVKPAHLKTLHRTSACAGNNNPPNEVVETYVHSKQDWSSRFSTLPDKNGWIRAKPA